jgi:hypothetical protein
MRGKLHYDIEQKHEFGARNTDVNEHDRLRALHQDEQSKKGSNECRYWIRPLLVLVSVTFLCIFAPRQLDRLGLRRGGSVQTTDSESASARPLAPSSGTPTLIPTMIPTIPATSTREYKAISPYIENPDTLVDASTSQGKAFAAVLDDGLSVEYRILQRFAMMVLFFSTNGMHWNFRHESNVFRSPSNESLPTGWDTFSSAECTWHGVECQQKSDGNWVVTTIRLGKQTPISVLCWLSAEGSHYFKFNCRR